MLSRLQAFEFCDQPWLPKVMREGFMDCLNAIHFSAIPPEHRALTIFSAFHHLPPEAAKALLAEIVAKRDGILIVEFTRRTLLDFISMLPALLGNLLALWFMRPSLIKFALSPLIALMVSFDGLISAWRSYTPREILAFLPKAGKYQVEYGEVPWGRMGLLKASFVFVKCQRILQTGPSGTEIGRKY